MFLAFTNHIQNFFKSLRNGQSSLQRGLLLLILIVFIVVSLTLVITSYLIYNSQEKSRQMLYRDYYLYIEHAFEDTFNKTESHLLSVCKKIVEHNPQSLDNIAKVLKETKYDKIINEAWYSWTLFNWIDKDNLCVANSIYGKVEYPIDLSNMREYLKYVVKMPWQLHVSQPTLGALSGEFVIPVAMGVATGKDKFYGTISTGIKIDEFAKAIYQNFTSYSPVIYIVINDFGQLIFHSKNIDLQASNNIYQQIIGEIKQLNTTHGNMKKAIYINDQYKLKSFYKLGKYPFYLILGESDQVQLEKFKLELYPHIIELMVISIIFIMLLLYYRNMVVKPIFNLVQATDDIAKGINSKIPQCNVLEIDILANQIQKLRNLNALMKEELLTCTLANTKLKEIKKSLFYNFIYQTSLIFNTVKALSQQTLDKWDKLQNDEKYNLAKLIKNNVIQVLEFTNNITKILDEDSLELNIEKHVNIVELIKLSIKNAKKLAESYNKNLKFILNIKNENNIYLECDVNQISLLLQNVFSNAVIYSKLLGSINITIEQCNQDAGFIQVTIEDEGVGIPEEEEEFIFFPFFRSSRTAYGSFESKGLGLSLCKKVIESHGGNIGARNNNIGTSIFFKLPIKSPKSISSENKFIIQTNDGAIILSNRESECAILLLQGKSTKEIARSLNLSSRTIEVYIANIKSKTGVKYKSELIAFLKNHSR